MARFVAYLATLIAFPVQFCYAVSGINCEGSGFCPLATFVHGSDNEGTDIVQGLRDALYASNVDSSTSYGNGDHVVCVTNTIPISIPIGIEFISVTVGGGIPAGGICAFPQKLPDGTTLTLGEIRQLADYLVQHNCKTCGSVPITYPSDNRVANGELTFNFVSNPACTGTCIENGAVNAHAQNSQSSVGAVTVTATTTATAATMVTTVTTPTSSAGVVTVVTTPTSTIRPSTVTSVASAVTVTETPTRTSTSVGIAQHPHESGHTRNGAVVFWLICIANMLALI